jgi:phosphopantothenoylcysteine decarboxylase
MMESDGSEKTFIPPNVVSSGNSIMKSNEQCCSFKEPKQALKVLVGVTGSVATIKVAELVDKLCSLDFVAEVVVVPTRMSMHFFKSEEVLLVNEKFVNKETVKIRTDEHEWSMWKGRGDPVLHIELGKWADVMLLAPLDANTLAKIAHGLCDNLLTCVLRAWEVKKNKPVIFCPAMNTKMWEHPLTERQIETLVGFGYQYVPPIEKTLMCGDVGLGAMASVDSIVATFCRIMS